MRSRDHKISQSPSFDLKREVKNAKVSFLCLSHQSLFLLTVLAPGKKKESKDSGSALSAYRNELLIIASKHLKFD